MSKSKVDSDPMPKRSAVLALVLVFALMKFVFAKVEYWSPFGSGYQNEQGEKILRFGTSWVDDYGVQISPFGPGWITNSGTTFSPFGGGLISFWGDKQIMPRPGGGWTTNNGTTISPIGNGFEVITPDTYFK